MKWYFAMNEEGLYDRNYLDLLRVSIHSAARHTSLRPMFLYDGAPNAFTNAFEASGVTIVPARTRFAEQIAQRWHNDPLGQRIARGAFLRLEMPFLENEDEFILYTDCDVMFMTDPKLGAFRPSFFAAAPEIEIGDYRQLNSGVLVMNSKGMRSAEPQFSDFVRANLHNLNVFDQSALTDFFAGRFDYLPPTLNWKPYWGDGLSAEIVHFHLKPYHIRAFARGGEDGGMEPLRYLFDKSPSYAIKISNKWYETLASARLALSTESDPAYGLISQDIWPYDFDGFSYLATYPDVLQAGMDPYTHFKTSGETEGRIAKRIGLGGSHL